MTHVYVVNYATEQELNAEYDDPSVKDMGLGDLARPTYLAVFTERPDQSVMDQVRDMVSDEIMDCDEDELPLGDRDYRLVLEKPMGPIGHGSNREEEMWALMRGDETHAIVVVQRVPLGI